MSFRFLLWTALISLMISGAAGWFFTGKREPTPEQKTFMEYRSILQDARTKAETGEAEAWVAYGKAMLKGPETLRNPEQAMVWFRKGADQGYVPAQVEVGKLYAAGLGVSQNYHRAMEWFQLAAQLSDNAEAHFQVAEGYFRGHGVPQDYGTAVPHYLKAAEKGHPISQYIIGSMYEAGWGVEQDLIEAWLWYKRAEPHAAAIMDHDPDYDLKLAIKRAAAQMNNSQKLAAERRLAKIKT